VSDTSGPRRLLFISNGYGEDSIAAAIVRNLPRGFIAEAYPTIGDGSAYRDTCAIVGPRAQLPSQGWRNVRFSLLRDLKSGALGTVWPGIKFLRRVRQSYDRIVVVGDIVGVAGSWVAGARNVIYLDVYKTGYGRSYSALERFFIKRTAATVFCRNDTLATALLAEGVDARAAGNIMMDVVPYGDYDAQSRRTRPTAVTLLPGSRQYTAESFALQIEAIRALPPEITPDIFLAVAGSISIDDLAKAAGLMRSGLLTGEAGDLSTLRDRQLTVHMARNALGNLIDASDVVLSQAGTATVQAIGLGRPVITFRNFRDRRSRFEDEQKLFGLSRIVTLPEVGSVSEALAILLANPAQREKLGAAGRERVGAPGAMAAIVEAITA
jgi:uncharacterized protein (TIGR03492 family)